MDTAFTPAAAAFVTRQETGAFAGAAASWLDDTTLEVQFTGTGPSSPPTKQVDYSAPPGFMQTLAGVPVSSSTGISTG